MGDFNKQVVVCLATDLEETARAIANKERSGRVSAILRFGNWTGGMPTQKMSKNGEGYALAGAQSRLVVVAHGDPTSRGINGSSALTGKKLAEFVSYLLDEPIGRITLHICYAGGNQDPEERVGPFDSLACDFASHAGRLAAEVTARCDRVGGTYNPETMKGFTRSVGGRSHNERRMEDKVVFTVNTSSTLDSSKSPSAVYNTKKTYPV
jgi:hypothetical protein